MVETGQEPSGEVSPSRFSDDTARVARWLLGTRLERRLSDGRLVRAVIVETEAYLGIRDRAAHTWNGRRTKRVEPMWGPPGHAYVYFVYGMHHCLNLVTREEGTPEAVLIRAAVSEKWWRGEPLSRAELLVAAGPGKLCKFLEIDRRLSGAPLGSDGLRLLARQPRLVARQPRPFSILSGPRVGIAYAGEARHWRLRFAVAGCPAVTHPGGLSPEDGPVEAALR
ncbi:MAG: DNA-3-methyladenine glycosylase [Thermoanaerobaculia bacterium]|nr:DNA-3-methyladenine glycosylase [Thermoanaerobaculia bacterium]